VFRTVSVGKLSSCREGAQKFRALILLLSPKVRALPGGRLFFGEEVPRGLCLSSASWLRIKA
jgi:hypothetical protein